MNGWGERNNERIYRFTHHYIPSKLESGMYSQSKTTQNEANREKMTDIEFIRLCFARGENQYSIFKITPWLKNTNIKFSIWKCNVISKFDRVFSFVGWGCRGNKKHKFRHFTETYIYKKRRCLMSKRCKILKLDSINYIELTD